MRCRFSHVQNHPVPERKSQTLPPPTPQIISSPPLPPISSPPPATNAKPAPHARAPAATFHFRSDDRPSRDARPPLHARVPPTYEIPPLVRVLIVASSLSLTCSLTLAPPPPIVHTPNSAHLRQPLLADQTRARRSPFPSPSARPARRLQPNRPTQPVNPRPLFHYKRIPALGVTFPTARASDHQLLRRAAISTIKHSTQPLSVSPTL